MALISTKTHALLDYAGGLGSLAAPKVLEDWRAAAIMGVSGAGTLTTSALTDYELGVQRRLPVPVHLMIDAAAGALLVGAAVLLRRRGVKLVDCAPLAVVGLSEMAGAALTERRPGDRPSPGSLYEVGAAARTTGAAGPPVAAAPADAPGPSVTPPQTPASDVERAEGADALALGSECVPDDDVLVAREESAAAAEAARIGGVVGQEAADPAMEPVYQAGGGEQDGWEATEAELIENATHGDGGANPIRDALSPELESDRSGAVYGEADRLTSTEVVDDPSTGSDDPADGPGMAAERGPDVQPDQAAERNG